MNTLYEGILGDIENRIDNMDTDLDEAYDFPDKKEFNRGSNNDALYISNQLSKIWSFGLHSIGEVSEYLAT